MRFKHIFFLIIGSPFFTGCSASSSNTDNTHLNTDTTIIVNQPVDDNEPVISHVVASGNVDLKFYWKNDLGENHANFLQLRDYLKNNGEELVFAMNGGMYDKEGGPVGLYIENGIVKKKLNTRSGSNANFYLMPNGVFYLTKGGYGHVCKTEDFILNDSVNYATQSGPMLLIDGEIHPAFKQGSANLNIRNGVGILPSGDVLFAMSKDEINFYDFAEWFKEMGCLNALYLDGYVSKTFLPSKGLSGDEPMHFGVIIGQTKKD